MVPYEGYTIYGPYRREDNRYHIIAYKSKRDKITVSYPKYLMEIKLQRYLKEGEEVHHLDKNTANNEYSNLMLLQENTHKSLPRIHYATEFVCPVCQTKFILSNKQMSTRAREINRGKCKSGPYCSRSCSGKVNN